MTESFTMVDFESQEKTISKFSGVPFADLTEKLGCEKFRARVWYLPPGDSLTYHKQREQEELYIPLDGPGQLRIDDELVDVPSGAAVRIPPQTPRQPINNGDNEHVWLIIGAPPVEDDGIIVDED